MSQPFHDSHSSAIKRALLGIIIFATIKITASLSYYSPSFARDE